MSWKMTCPTAEVMQCYQNSLSMYVDFFDRMVQDYYIAPLLHQESDFLDLSKFCKKQSVFIRSGTDMQIIFFERKY